MDAYDGEQEMIQETGTPSSPSYESLGSSQTSDSAVSWISWFCSLPGHDFFCEVPEDFVEDDFNLFGLNTAVDSYNEALDTILDLEVDDDSLQDDGMVSIERSAEMLYGLIHARYIVTKAGLAAVLQKYDRRVFGSCPRVLCDNAPLLPIGQYDAVGKEGVKVFCGKCGDLYQPRESRHQALDGAYFGTTLPGMFSLTYPERIPKNSIVFPETSERLVPPPPAPADNTDTGMSDSELSEDDKPRRQHRTYQEPPHSEVYQSQIFGFGVSEYSKSGPRMKWLRSVPEK